MCVALGGYKAMDTTLWYGKMQYGHLLSFCPQSYSLGCSPQSHLGTRDSQRLSSLSPCSLEREE